MANKKAPYKDPVTITRFAEFLDSLSHTSNKHVNISELVSDDAYKKYLVYMSKHEEFAETLNYPQFEKVFEIAVLLRGNV